MLPVLANNPRDRLAHIKGTVNEMREQVELLRTRKVGATTVESEAVNSLHFMIKRLSGDLSRLSLFL
jgi:hypothetical protein